MSSQFPSSEQAQPDRRGEVVGGRYRLVEVIDRGGQAAVYRGVDLRAGDEVAIKVLAPPKRGDTAWRDRMLREVHALTVLAGTAAVRVYHQVWAEDGTLFLIMELLKGANFETYLDLQKQRGTRLGLFELRPIVEPVVATLETAHAKGILHRDLKPSNIFVQIDGSVRLLDFGFAKFLRMRSVTLAGHIAGSPSYIAPECWKETTESLDQRIDVYGLSAVLFSALAGRPPFVGEGVIQIMRQCSTAERPSLHALRPDLPPKVDDWVKAALAIEPDERFVSVRASWNALKTALG
ncbi:MAG TPA: serine/threonine-protein kinase [Polyangiaceae bacterium]|nr:serine/threonine-protein kinase [Polyangiaceae bacterium]